jgi:hypothetical protein
MHVHNRIAGMAGEYPFGPAEKEEFIRRVKRLAQLYVIEPIAVQVMGNHYHIILYVPGRPPSNEQALRRFKRYYGSTRGIRVDSAKCSRLAAKLRDVSEFMRELQQPYTRWFNRTRSRPRRGHLWGDRYKNTILEDGLAVWRCWLYVEMNPVRARMVSDPADYRFCSFGEWSATGRHPFEAAVCTRLLPRLRELLGVKSIGDVRKQMRVEFAHRRAVEAHQAPEQIEAALRTAAEKEHFVTCLDRRVRYWVDGLVIGSDIFVRNTIARYRTGLKRKRRRFTRARDPNNGKGVDLYCFKQLRVLLE